MIVAGANGTEFHPGQFNLPPSFSSCCACSC